MRAVQRPAGQERSGDPDRPWRGAAVTVAPELFVTTPTYAWYALLPVMLVAYGAPVEWLALALAGTAAQFATDAGPATTTVQQRAYAPALVVVVAGLIVRRRRTAVP